MQRRIPWLVALMVWASACDDSVTVSRLEEAKRLLGIRIEQRQADLDKEEAPARRMLEVLREKLQEQRHVSTREELEALVAASPEPVQVEVLEKPRGWDMLRVRFSGRTRRTIPRGMKVVWRLNFLALDAFESDESGWTAEGRLHLTHPCEHPSWDEEPLSVPPPRFLEGLRTRRLREEIAEGSRELAALDAQLSARGLAELPRQHRCAAHQVAFFEEIDRDSVMSAWYALWDSFPMARGRLYREGEVVVFEGRFPRDTRGLSWMREQEPGDWKWEESSLAEEYELVEFRPEGVLKLRRRRGGGQ